MIRKPDGSDFVAEPKMVRAVNFARDTAPKVAKGGRVARARMAVLMWGWLTFAMGFGALATLLTNPLAGLLVGGPIAYGCYRGLQHAKRKAREAAL